MRLVVTASSFVSSNFILWDINNNYKPIKFPALHFNSIITVAFSTDSKYLAIGYRDLSIQLFEITYPKSNESIDEHCLTLLNNYTLKSEQYLLRPYSVQFSPKNSYLTVYYEQKAEGDNIIMHYKLDTISENNYVIKEISAKIKTFFFSPDEKIFGFHKIKKNKKDKNYLIITNFIDDKQKKLEVNDDEYFYGFDLKNQLFFEDEDSLHYLQESPTRWDCHEIFYKPSWFNGNLKKKYAKYINNSTINNSYGAFLGKKVHVFDEGSSVDYIYVPERPTLKTIIARLALKKTISKRYDEDFEYLKMYADSNTNYSFLDDYKQQQHSLKNDQQFIATFIQNKMMPYFNNASQNDEDPFTHKAFKQFNIDLASGIRKKVLRKVQINFDEQYNNAHTYNKLFKCLCSRECAFLETYAVRSCFFESPIVRVVKKIQQKWNKRKNKTSKKSMKRSQDLNLRFTNLDEPLKTIVNDYLSAQSKSKNF